MSADQLKVVWERERLMKMRAHEIQQRIHDYEKNMKLKALMEQVPPWVDESPPRPYTVFKIPAAWKRLYTKELARAKEAQVIEYV